MPTQTEGELAARDLQALDKIAGAREQHSPSVFDRGEADGGGKMTLPQRRRVEQQQIAAADRAWRDASGGSSRSSL